jgi:hypothetical protein
MLEQVAGLLESAADFAEWPEDVRIALALALEDGSMPDTETWKAVTLRRHLFGPAGVVPEPMASMQIRRPLLVGAPRRCAPGSPPVFDTVSPRTCCRPRADRSAQTGLACNAKRRLLDLRKRRCGSMLDERSLVLVDDVTPVLRQFLVLRGIIS